MAPATSPRHAQVIAALPALSPPRARRELLLDEELAHVRAGVGGLSPAARRAVRDVLESMLAESSGDAALLRTLEALGTARAA